MAINCGYPECPHFSEDEEIFYCPNPINGRACLGQKNGQELDFGDEEESEE